MRRRHRLMAALLVVIVAALGVSYVLTREPPPVTDYSTLLQYLRDSGASVEEIGEPRFFTVPGRRVTEGEHESLVFTVPGRHVTVNANNIGVYEFENAEAMEAEASYVIPSGHGIDREGLSVRISWTTPPRFYKEGRIIVIYIGDDPQMISLLEDLLGKPFAGTADN
ncbi:MAG: hypothetical protein ACNA7X_01525 [Dehalococcoidia bacterium]